MRGEIRGLNSRTALQTERLEYWRGKRNTKCSGGMRRYLVEHQERRQLAGQILTLKDESVGSKQD